ncbi:DUF1617 family protein [Pisciglobus halotolerans]|uniref:DUF1617 family protein n=1 Tax=Pisciglobus halotolerans TaxID=745365 RepID=A0A1I3C1U8_9LACT|nr:DUF1617 family protein [Pisciglobus halotolerans]SFH68537.1 Protein of unknown function [Pisciglobus halotolerans]
MKTIKLENKSIVPVFNFLQSVNLKANKASRGRTQFSKRLEEKNKEFNEALDEIRKEYFEIDENGELIIENDKYIYKDESQETEVNEKIKELNEEKFEIHFGEYSTKYENLFTALDNLEIELSGQDAFAYNELMDAYEANEDKEEEE